MPPPEIRYCRHIRYDGISRHATCHKTRLACRCHGCHNIATDVSPDYAACWLTLDTHAAIFIELRRPRAAAADDTGDIMIRLRLLPQAMMTCHVTVTPNIYTPTPMSYDNNEIATIRGRRH